jgi:DNA-binding NarL/FixJ family response regulator
MEKGPGEHKTNGNGTPIRIVIADSKAHFRETVRRVLCRYSNCEVADEAATLPEAIAKITAAKPDLLLLDLGLVASPGLTRLRRLARHYPSLQIVVLLTDFSTDYETAIQSLGQYLCVAKDQLEEHLARVIDGVKPSMR